MGGSSRGQRLYSATGFPVPGSSGRGSPIPEKRAWAAVTVVDDAEISERRTASASVSANGRDLSESGAAQQ